MPSFPSFKFTKKPKDEQEIKDFWEITIHMTPGCFLLKPACKDCKDRGDLKKCPPAFAREQLERWSLWSDAEYERLRDLHRPKQAATAD